MPSASAEIREQVLPALLDLLRTRFYSTRTASEWHRDHDRLLFALTWPAQWLERRNLCCRSERFQRLIAERIEAIALHGDPLRYNIYFPNYLLKCLQDWFAHHGHELDSELRRIDCVLHAALAAIPWADQAKIDARQLEVLAATHRLLHARYQRKILLKSTAEPRQLSLF